MNTQHHLTLIMRTNSYDCERAYCNAPAFFRISHSRKPKDNWYQISSYKLCLRHALAAAKKWSIPMPRGTERIKQEDKVR